MGLTLTFDTGVSLSQSQFTEGKQPIYITGGYSALKNHGKTRICGLLHNEGHLNRGWTMGPLWLPNICWVYWHFV